MKVLFATVLIAAAAFAQDAPAVASNPVVEFKGVIKQLHISPGQGTPYLDVQRGAETTKVYLGAMHYLISENFSPKAGQEIVVKGYKMTDSVTAIQVELPAERKTLKLRDEKGWPLWRRGMMRGGHGKQ